MQQQAFNKSIIRDFYVRSMGQGDIAFAEHVLADDYIQHSPGMKPGKAGVLEALQYMKQMPKPAIATKPFMRLIADGDYVVTNLCFDWGGQRKAVIDVFRFEEGKVAEHWDAVEDEPAATANGHLIMDGPMPVEDVALATANKRMVNTFFELVYVNRQLGDLPRFVSQDLIQHNPAIANGLAGLENYLHQTNNNHTVDQVHRIIGEGDFVVVQASGWFEQKPTTYYDIFRLSAGKIVEHWSLKRTTA